MTYIKRLEKLGMRRIKYTRFYNWTKEILLNRESPLSDRMGLVGIYLGLLMGTIGLITMYFTGFRGWSFYTLLAVVICTPFIFVVLYRFRFSITTIARVVGIYSMIGTSLLITDITIPIGIACIWTIFNISYLAICFGRKDGAVLSLTNLVLVLCALTIRGYLAYGTLIFIAAHPEMINLVVSGTLCSVTVIAGMISLKKFTHMESEISFENERKALLAAETSKVFVANMSHELRTPLNAVLGFNELILQEVNPYRMAMEGDADYGKILDYANEVSKSGKCLLSLLNDVIDFSIIEANQLELLNEVYNVREMVSDSETAILDFVKDKNLEYRCVISDKVPKLLYGDPVRIRQCITNLLSNAVRFTEEGTVVLSLDVVESPQGKLLCVTVTDSGCGIASEDMERIFERYTKLDKIIGGAGLGLSIAKRLVEAMGGEIGLESKVGEGSRFYFYIKQDCVEVECNDELQNLRGRSLQILGVDDMKINTMLLKHFCEEVDVEIDFTACDSGKAAVEKCREKRYDIILMDHMMPGLDGVETFKILRADSMNRSTPVVMVTANAQTGDREKYIDKYGFDDYVSKPISFENFRKIIGRWANGK